MDVDAVNTWEKNFKHFRTKGETRWLPSATAVPGMIPMSAKIDYDYSEDKSAVAIAQGEITSPQTRLEFSGPLGAGDSALELELRAGNLLEWDDFITAAPGTRRAHP